MNTYKAKCGKQRVKVPADIAVVTVGHAIDLDLVSTGWMRNRPQICTIPLSVYTGPTEPGEFEYRQPCKFENWKMQV